MLKTILHNRYYVKRSVERMLKTKTLNAKGDFTLIRGLPQLLKRRREELNVSMDRLSKLTNISKSTLYKYERGEVSPNGIRLLKLCYALQIDYKTLNNSSPLK